MHNKRFRVRGTHSHAGWTSQGRAGLGLGDLAGDEVLAGRAAVSGGAQRSAVRRVFRVLKNVFDPICGADPRKWSCSSYQKRVS